MQDSPVAKRRKQVINATRRCNECSEEALGRCPDCRHNLCEDHFPKQQHSPCAEKQMQMAQTQVCYVCSDQVYPDQWSVSHTSHFADQYRCKGCGRYICDELHTRRKLDDIFIVREGLRGHRYQFTARYCDICSPLYRFGGIKGLARLLVVVGTVVVTILFYLHR
ncbi:MAG TPA: hypothetical protein VKP04_00435 [Ktedonobacteraceae bacterium]|nr:hypothetical protein [Ktedonobacteraceae bacterium]